MSEDFYGRLTHLNAVARMHIATYLAGGLPAGLADFLDSAEWLFSRTGENSFAWVCQHNGLDLTRARIALLQIKTNRLMAETGGPQLTLIRGGRDAEAA